MRPFTIHTADTVPAEIIPLFENKMKDPGFVPNIFAIAAESVPAAMAYEAMSEKFAKSSFTTTEKETIEIVTSIENNCKYCVAGHSAFATMKGVSSEIIEALRNGGEIEDPQISALRDFTKKLIRSKGKVTSKDIILFFDAGFTRAQMMELALGICLKTFTNYISNAVSLPLDEAFEPYAWSGLQAEQNKEIYQHKA